jgi:hypothetical protein
MRTGRWLLVVAISLPGLHLMSQGERRDAFSPGGRVLLDAHNCYPYGEWWSDRIDRALSTGTPLAIEQDLVWYREPRKGALTSGFVAPPDRRSISPRCPATFIGRWAIRFPTR